MPDFSSQQGPFLQTPSQTVGPFFGYALPYAGGPDVAPPWHPDAVRFHGTVLDGAGDPVPDAVIEIWHADAAGRPIAVRGSLERDGHGVTGFGRAAVDRDGHYAFTTIKPGATRADAAPYVLVDRVRPRAAAPSLHPGVLRRRGRAQRARPAARERRSAPRRGTLVAAADGAGGYRFDIRLQGDGETVFLDFEGVAR